MEWVENIGKDKVIIKTVDIKDKIRFRQKTIEIDRILWTVDLEKLQVSNKKHELNDGWERTANSGYEDQLLWPWEEVWAADWPEIVNQLDHRESAGIGQG